MSNSLSSMLFRVTKIFSGEMLLSGFHFILNVIFVRELVAKEYGVFALVFMAFGLTYAVSQALFTTPLTIFIPRLKGKKAILKLDAIYGSLSLYFSILLFLFTFSFCYFLTNDGIKSLLLASALGLWTLRFGLRGQLIARENINIVMIIDYFYVFSGLISLIFCLAIVTFFTLEIALICVIIPNIISIFVGLVLKKEPIKLVFSKRHLNFYRENSLKSVVWDCFTIAVSFVQSHLQTLIVAWFFGVGSYAPFAAALVLFSPFRTVTLAIGHILRPNFTKGFLDKNIDRIKKLLFSGSALMFVVTLSFSFAIWIFWPIIYSALFKQQLSHAPIALIVLLNALAAVFYTQGNVFQFFLQIAEKNKEITIARLIGTIFGLIALFPLLTFAPLPYIIVALIISEAVSLLMLVILTRQILTRFNETH